MRLPRNRFVTVKKIGIVVFAVFIAIENGLVKRITALEHQGTYTLGELRIANERDTRLSSL